MYYDNVFYSDCIHLLDSDLDVGIIKENIKNMLNLDNIEQTKCYIQVFDKNKIVVNLTQKPFIYQLDYHVKNKFNIFI